MARRWSAMWRCTSRPGIGITTGMTRIQNYARVVLHVVLYESRGRDSGRGYRVAAPPLLLKRDLEEYAMEEALHRIEGTDSRGMLAGLIEMSRDAQAEYLVGLSRERWAQKVGSRGGVLSVATGRRLVMRWRLRRSDMREPRADGSHRFSPYASRFRGAGGRRQFLKKSSGHGS